MSSFKVHVKVHAFQVKVHGFSIQSMQEKHQGSDLPAMIIVFSHPGQVSRIRLPGHGYSSSLQPSRSSIKILISHYMVIGQTARIKTQIWATVCLRSGYTMKNLFSFQCNRYIHLVRPLVTVGFISLLASQSKPAIMDPISVQCYSVLVVKVPLLSMPMIPNLSPIQSDRATIKDSISIQYDSVFTAQVEEQGFLLHPRLQPRPIDPGLLSSRPKPTIKALIFFWAHSKRSMLSSTSKVAVHAENQDCTSKNRVKSNRRKGQQSRCHSPSWMLGIPVSLVNMDDQVSAFCRGQEINFLLSTMIHSILNPSPTIKLWLSGKG
ncbi:hypothetical protein PHYBLDRAFT_170026 [Phycomyces blakesleeanus NRRL 1555(-)]|uniref:Uncharacterized protein n=1 Tax=Phycomyces blakesleeanus (strain ATCC 8743b / DSM 1359 / FGSC 10004 / NBRC 33097 / NRRL 1555) TaxID=763407 RepID=A0A162U3Q7_PHYB8|nr:hypothetical protein PHYBLDRAFT_170026 [Phycomyces blakesleeanus NRRL 1555(-)]OAD72133.1 hypothetical protein PHYBLDRAFT_170026 [Phycomyces blakesleeanus NRRL 1555(-)]|eukprot:XP_018290173.1 hypothetical protein PHYBLDRAFT_170026 [Phycomyces blakesleeanus NRRL 1555(-)]